MAENVIEVRNLTKVFNKTITAVDHVSFELKRGEIYGFLGPNGAGKTTTISMLATMLKPTEGTATVCGHDIIKDCDEVRRCIGIVFQDPSLDDRLTGKENLDFHARLYRLKRDIRKKRLIDTVIKSSHSFLSSLLLSRAMRYSRTVLYPNRCIWRRIRFLTPFLTLR